jgi:anti-sigma regulatory factor (Ser/Thr protein kinase)
MAGAELRLDPVPNSVPTARRWLREALEFDGRVDVDIACLLLSELVTNALLHARTPLTVRALDDSRAVRVAVIDSGTPLRGYAPLDGSAGRGLDIVSSLADAWGIEPNGDDTPGTTAWFELNRLTHTPVAAQGDRSA